jgi:tetratricopeptide (TPR) repeat protein/DNA-binding MarR family transcriptional regulator
MIPSNYNITIQDAVILHLLQYSRYQDEIEVPDDVVQHKIAEIVGIKRSQVSGVMKRLKEKEYVKERLAHVRDLTRKRKVYFLTPNGITFARKLQENIENKSIIYKSDEGEVKTLKICEINKHLSTPIPLIKLLSIITPDGYLDSKKLQEYEKISIAETTDSNGYNSTTFIAGMTLPTRFVGRNKELIQIKSWLNNELPRILIIKGIPGIGKTTIAAKITHVFTQEFNNSTFWYRFHEWDTIRSTLRKLSEFLLQLGRNELKFYLDNESHIHLAEIMRILKVDLQDLNALFVFDDVQKINQELKQLFSIFVELMDLEKSKNINIIILTRSTVKFYDRRKVVIKKLIFEFELGGLDSKSSKQLLNIDNIKESDFNKIYKITEGHPLALELINIHLSSKSLDPSSGLGLGDLFKSEEDLNKYLREEILSDLSSSEIRILELISIFRYPAPQDSIFIDEQIDLKCIDTLFEKSLILETTAGYDIHELIREFFYNRMPSQLKKQYHTLAADYYTNDIKTEKIKDSSSRIKPEAIIEAQYHYICSGNYEKAARLVVEYVDTLLSQGYSDELMKIIKELGLGRVKEEKLSELQIIKGHVLRMNGEWEDARECYNKSLELSKLHEDDIGKARAYNAIGTVFYRQGKWNEAMDSFNHGLKIAENEKDEQYCSKLYSNIALIHWGEGDYNSAKDLIQKSLDLCNKLNDIKGIARAYNNLGIIYWEKKELDEAITAYKMSLKLSQELEDKRTIAILYDNLGEVYRVKGISKKAKEYYQKSLDLSKELGFKWQIAEVYCNLGQMYQDKNRTKSTEYLNSALEIFSNLGAKREMDKVKNLICRE